jgi:ribose-phosphate pyrophosphokinase
VFVRLELTVFSGRSNPALGLEVCNAIGIKQGSLEVIRFSDGELSVDIADNVRGRDVFVIQSTSAPGNDHILELLIIIDALKRASAGRITAVIPYFGYARQDRKLRPRVPITAKLIANLLTSSGAHRVLAMDLHSGQIMGFFDIPVDNLNALPVFVPYLIDKYTGEDITVISPDSGGVERARLYATRLNNSALAVIDKRRSGPNQVAEMNVVGDVRGKTCIIVDDIVDTAGTLVKAADTLKKAGANKVVACCTHPVCSGTAIEKINDSEIEELVVSDTIPLLGASQCSRIKVLSVAQFFAEAIQRIHSHDSVSSMFK